MKLLLAWLASAGIAMGVIITGPPTTGSGGGGGGGISESTATNIAAYQAQIATNGLALGSGVTVAQLAQTNYIPRVLISDTTPQDPYRWINATNGLIRFPAWSSDRITGSLTPGIHFLSVTNGADHFSIDVQHDHAAAGKSEARMIGLWDMAIVPGYNSGIQLGASTDNYNQEVHVQYANRMGWSHLFNLRGNTNGNIGSITFQGRRISTSTNLSELWIWANEPTWNNYPTPGFSATGPQIAKLAIGGTYFYTDLYTPRTIVTNRQLIGVGPMFYSTDGGMELSSGYSDGFMVGGDLGAATRTTGSSKYFWLTMTPKTHSDARMNLLSAANDGATTATINIGGGSGSATAPANRVKIYAGADSTVNGTGSLGIDVSNGLVTTTNLAVPTGTKTAPAISKSGATTTGFYFTSGGGFGFSTGGTSAMTMDTASTGLELYPTWPISWGATAGDSAADTYIRRLSAGTVSITTNLFIAGSLTTTNGYSEAVTQEYSTNSAGNAAGSIFGLDLNLATATILQTNTMQFTNTLSVLPAGYTKTLNRTIIGSGNTFSVNPLWHGVGSYSTNGGALVNGTHYKFSLEINYIVSSNAYYWAIVPCNN